VHLPAGGDVPDPDCRILAGAGDELAVGAEGDAEDLALPAGQGEQVRVAEVPNVVRFPAAAFGRAEGEELLGPGDVVLPPGAMGPVDACQVEEGLGPLALGLLAPASGLLVAAGDLGLLLRLPGLVALFLRCLPCLGLADPRRLGLLLRPVGQVALL